LLFQSIQSGELGISPGPSTYDAYTLACIRSRAWNDVLEAYETMKATEVVPSPTVCHGIILATFKIGGKSATKALLEEFLSSGAQLNHACALLAMKIMIPGGDSFKGRFTLSSVRDSLRDSSEHQQDETLQLAKLNLIRSVRRCEVEEVRRPTAALTEQKIRDGQRTAWRRVLKHLLEYVNQLEGAATTSSSTSSST